MSDRGRTAGSAPDSRASPASPPRLLNQRPARPLPRDHGWTEERGGQHVVTMTQAGGARSPCRITAAVIIRVT